MPINVEQVLRRAACLPPKPWSTDEKDAVFEWLFKEELARMVRFSYSSLKGCGGSKEDAKYVVSDTVHDLCKYICSYDPGKSSHPRVGDWGKAAFHTWVYTALRNKLIARCRELRAEQRVFPSEPAAGQERDGLENELNAGRQPTGALPIKAPSLPPDYQELLGFLPRRELQAVDLIVRLGCSKKEAAATERCSEGTMKVRYFTAVHRLEAVQGWLETLAPGKARLLRLFVGLRLPLAEAARRIGASEPEALRMLAEACVEMAVRTFARGRLMHSEVEERLCGAGGGRRSM